MSHDPLAVADAFNAAIKARSEAALTAVYADDAVIWNNATQTDQTRTENVAVLGQVFRISSELEYVDVRRHLIDGGFVQIRDNTITILTRKAVPAGEISIPAVEADLKLQGDKATSEDAINARLAKQDRDRAKLRVARHEGAKS